MRPSAPLPCLAILLWCGFLASLIIKDRASTPVEALRKPDVNTPQHAPLAAEWREFQIFPERATAGAMGTLRIQVPRRHGVHRGLALTVRGQAPVHSRGVEVFLDGIWVWPRRGNFTVERWFDCYGPARTVIEIRVAGRTTVLESVDFEIVPCDEEDARKSDVRARLQSGDLEVVRLALGELYVRPDLRLAPDLLRLVSESTDTVVRGSALHVLRKARCIRAVPKLIRMLGGDREVQRALVHLALKDILLGSGMNSRAEMLRLPELRAGAPEEEQAWWTDYFLRNEARLRCQLGQWGGRMNCTVAPHR